MSDSDRDCESRAWSWHVFASLREGEQVYVNDRDEPLTLVERTRDSRSRHYQLTLRGDGTTYSTILDPDSPEKSVRALHAAGVEEIPIRSARRSDGEAIVADVRADEWIDGADADLR